jgi:hypothetical protein
LLNINCHKSFSLLTIILLLSSFSPTTNTSQADTSGRGTWAPYTPKDVMIGRWMALCDAHPGMASYEVIGHTVQGRDIWLFKIGSPSGARVMYDGECHGPEDGGTETLFKFCKWLLESDDALANHILENNYHLIIPVLNVDTGARQNMRREYTLENGKTIEVPHGVDLNRNSLYNWGHSGSSNPEDDYSYRGLYAGSEPETMAYHNAVAEYLPLIYVNTHIGAETMITYSNTDFEEEITSLINENKQQYDNTFSYPIHFSRGGSGSIAADADNNFGASGWLWEISTWEHLKPTLSEWLDVYYPRVFPIFLAFAKAAENKQSTQTKQTPTSNPPPTSKTNKNLSQSTHNISIDNIKSSPIPANQIQLVKIQVITSNKGNYKESFNLTIYINKIPVETKKVTLDAKKTTTIDFELNTSNLSPGNYTITAYAEPVPKENDEADNSFQLASAFQVVQPISPEDSMDGDMEGEVRDPTPVIIIPILIAAVFMCPLLVEKKMRKNSGKNHEHQITAHSSDLPLPEY